VYVWHFLLTLLIQRSVRGAGFAGAAGFMLTLGAVSTSSLALAAVSYRLIERPALALKRYFSAPSTLG